jgi:hypothetical protein
MRGSRHILFLANLLINFGCYDEIHLTGLCCNNLLCSLGTAAELDHISLFLFSILENGISFESSDAVLSSHPKISDFANEFCFLCLFLLVAG